MFARAILLVFVVATAPATGCAGAQKTDEAESPKKNEKAKRDHPVDEDAVSEEGKQWGGWRWKGKRAECYYVFNNRCFETRAAACKVASCGKADCRVKAGAPAKISCAE